MAKKKQSVCVCVIGKGGGGGGIRLGLSSFSHMHMLCTYAQRFLTKPSRSLLEASLAKLFLVFSVFHKAISRKIVHEVFSIPTETISQDAFSQEPSRSLMQAPPASFLSRACSIFYQAISRKVFSHGTSISYASISQNFA